jgi:hypothetical protein
MQNILKNRKNKIYGWSVVLMSILSWVFFMQSCNNEELDVASNNLKNSNFALFEKTFAQGLYSEKDDLKLIGFKTYLLW